MRRYRDNNTRPRCNQDQRCMMDKIQSLSFALVETTLYLDGHPHHRMALAYYTKIKNELDALTREYEMKYAPITNMSAGGDERMGWQWVKQPWPWEVNFPEGGDRPEMNEGQDEQRRLSCTGEEREED